MFKEIFTKEVLENLYIRDGITITSIARLYKTSNNTVRLYMKKCGIALKSVTADLTGKRFGKLIAIRLSGKDKHHKARWHCKCDCGTTAEINAASLTRGLTTSCGCHKSYVCRKGGYKDISKNFWRRLLQNANQRGYECNITIEYVWEVYEKQNRLCALSGLPVVFFHDSNRLSEQTASIDRIDSSKGYVEGNIQIVNKVINQMKSYLSDDEFIAFCNLVAERNSQTHEDSIYKASRSILRKI